MNSDDDISSAPLTRIVCAAIRHKSGVVLAGVRHYDNWTMRPMLKLLGCEPGDSWYGAQQGFLTNTGEFLNREQAWEIADAAGQIRQTTGLVGTLYSEDLY